MSKKPIGSGGVPESKAEAIPEPKDSTIVELRKKAEIIDATKYMKERGVVVQSQEQVPQDAETRTLKEMEKAVGELGGQQLSAFERIYSLVGERGADDVQDVRIPRSHYDSPKLQKPLHHISQRLVESILYGEGDAQLKNPSQVVPWLFENGKVRDEYRTPLAFLRKEAVRKIIKEFTPLRKELDAISDVQEYKKRWDALSPREQVIVSLVQDVRQIEHDNKIFEMLFVRQNAQKKPAPFWTAFEKRKKGAVPSRVEIQTTVPLSRRRAMEVRPGLMGGAQMTFNLRYDDGRIFLDRFGWQIQRVEGFEEELSPVERLKLVNTPLRDAPHFLIKKVADKFGDAAPEWIAERAALAE